jgi:large subunit ribosomal protein L15
MQIHELKRKHKNIGKNRVGRGGRKGTYSGRGMKGQNQRAGRKKVPIIKEIIKRYPKLKGYRSFRFAKDTQVVNLEVLEKNFKDGDVINPENLVKMGLVGRIKGKTPKVKILGSDKLTKKFIIEKCSASKPAKEAIEKANGSFK